MFLFFIELGEITSTLVIIDIKATIQLYFICMTYAYMDARFTCTFPDKNLKSI